MTDHPSASSDAVPVSPASNSEPEEIEEQQQGEGEVVERHGVDDDDDTTTMMIPHLYILPPRPIPLRSTDHVVALPPLRPEEQVQSIRVALMDVRTYAHYTSYRLELEIIPDRTKVTKMMMMSTSQTDPNRVNGTATSLTGKDVDICIPVQYLPYPNNADTDATIVLDDYGDLQVIGQHLSKLSCSSSLSSSDSSNNMIVGLRIVLERYTISSLREHILRCKYLLTSGQLPTITTLFEVPTNENEEPPAPPPPSGDPAEGKDHTDTAVVMASTAATTTSDPVDSQNSTTTVVNGEAEVANTNEAEKSSIPLPDLHTTPNIVVDGSNIQDYFYLTLGEDRDVLHRDVANSNESHAINGIGPNHKTPKSHKKKGKHHKNGHDKNVNGTATTTPTAKSENGNDPISHTIDATTMTTTTASTTKQLIQRYNELDELSRCTCNVIIQYSGYHPPPNHRKLLGDLAYLMITIPKCTSHYDTHNQNNAMSETSHPSSNSSSTIVHITCTASGFYLNQTVDTITFNPAPAIPESHFSHTLLDCLLSVSSDFRQLWTTALNAAKERNDMPATATTTETTSILPSILRAAIRGDFDGFRSNIMAVQIIKEAYDAAVASPTWLVPSLTKYTEKQDQQQGRWNHNACHCYSQQRTEDELQRTYGMLENVRSGTITRDWNEELQIAREMAVSTSQERLERARMIHKVMMEFGEASLHSVMAIANGHVLPMNPNESIRSQVFLINNIFVSRGVDTGPETFKITRGDRAARKASNRDLQCIGFFYRLDSSGSSSNRGTNLHTLATVLIDYLGTRYVCQSILPGILIGDKSHTLLYGSVDAGAPLKFDDDLEKTLEEKLGQNFMIAPRPIYRTPLSAERIVEIEQQRKPNAQMYNKSKTVSDCDLPGKDDIIRTCVAVEAKGILGSDQRRYMLDISRLTPRDANWVPKEDGGTGKYEEIMNLNKQQKTIDDIVPVSLNDDEWVMCVLRPELITRYTQVMMKQFIDVQSKDKEKDEAEKHASTLDEKDEETAEQKEEAANKSNGADTTAYLQSLKFNVNVFIPHIRAITETAIVEQIKEDEKMVRGISSYLWDDVLPKITVAIREGAVNQLPVDGKSLTEFLHRNGVNCRYLGRLALLAHEQEVKDMQVEAELKLGKRTTIERKTMPRCWLEMLECEMVARSAKHVLDEYLTSNGGVAALQPAQTIASFLSALVSEAEETAAQTETRNSKRMANEADDDDYAALTIANIGGNGDAVTARIKSRSEVWRDIEIDIGRRFRYSLTLFNRGNKSHRALYIPLLRRVCQRTGVILSAKKYDIGGKCLCGGGASLNGRLMPSFPISALDVVDVVPLMKHTAAYHEGFQLCSVGTTAVCLPPLQISFPDARATLERAHIQTSCRALGRALELAQEAGSLYQRVTDNVAHPGVIESIDLMATIFFEAGDTSNAVANAEKALTLTLQSGGLDSAAAFNAHQLLFQMLFTAHDMERAVKHIRASMYILELMAGPRHTEQYSAYHKLGTVYSYPEYNGRYLAIALECFREAWNRESCDRLMDGFMAKNFARTLLGLENFVDALDYERKANHTLTMFLGKSHKMVLESDATLKVLSALAVEKGNKGVVGDAKSNQTTTRPAVEDTEAAAIADSIAADLLAEEERSSNKKKGDKKKRGKK